MTADYAAVQLHCSRLPLQKCKPGTWNLALEVGWEGDGAVQQRQWRLKLKCQGFVQSPTSRWCGRGGSTAPPRHVLPWGNPKDMWLWPLHHGTPFAHCSRQSCTQRCRGEPGMCPRYRQDGVQICNWFWYSCWQVGLAF